MPIEGPQAILLNDKPDEPFVVSDVTVEVCEEATTGTTSFLLRIML